MVKIKVEKEIERCCDCPFYIMHGGPGSVMICNHPSVKTMEEAYDLVSHLICNVSFPDKCPALTEEKRKEIFEEKNKSDKLRSDLKTLEWTQLGNKTVS